MGNVASDTIRQHFGLARTNRASKSNNPHATDQLEHTVEFLFADAVEPTLLRTGLLQIHNGRKDHCPDRDIGGYWGAWLKFWRTPLLHARCRSDLLTAPARVLNLKTVPSTIPDAVLETVETLLSAVETAVYYSTGQAAFNRLVPRMMQMTTAQRTRLQDACQREDAPNFNERLARVPFDLSVAILQNGPWFPRKTDCDTALTTFCEKYAAENSAAVLSRMDEVAEFVDMLASSSVAAGAGQGGAEVPDSNASARLAHVDQRHRP